MAKKLAAPIPRIALTPPEAAAAIGVGPDFFDENVAPELRLIRRGRKRLVPVTELERWVVESAGRPIADEVAGVRTRSYIRTTTKQPPAARQRRPRA
jgi:hypothetical protein